MRDRNGGKCDTINAVTKNVELQMADQRDRGGKYSIHRKMQHQILFISGVERRKYILTF